MPLFKCSASKAKPKNGIAYITDEKKAKIVSVRNLFEDEDYAKQFDETASRFGKGDKFDERKYYHCKLSCARKDNVSPEKAHAYAEELVAKLFKDYLKNFNVKEVPSFRYRITSYGPVTKNTKLRNYYRLRETDDFFMGPGPNGTKWHNLLKYLPKETYQSAHPDWYSMNGQTLCLSARGDETEKEALFEEFVNRFIEVLDAHPDKELITITQEDNSGWCNCPACAASTEKYGANSALMIQFCNRVSDAVKAHYEAEGKTRDVQILFFAYQSTLAAPVKQVGDKFEPIDDTVVCRDNVNVFYAPISNDFTVSFKQNPFSDTAQTMKKWQALSQHIYMWTYCTNFGDYFSPYNTFSSMQENYSFMRDLGIEYLFDQCCWEESVAEPAFNTLKAYLISKLLWNCDQDVNSLISDFFAHYYKDASKAMQEAFSYYLSWAKYQHDTVGMLGGVYQSNTEDPRYWPQPVLLSILEKMDKAYEAIEPLKNTDPTTYDTLRERICLETLSFRRLNILLYGSRYTSSEELALKLAFKADVDRIGIVMCAENTGVSNIYAAMGLK